jgi:effector-binding domain-containing protein
MIDAPRILQTHPKLTAIIHLTVPRSEIREVMGPARAELMEAVASQEIAVTGPWFTHHLKMDPEIFDFEVSVPLAGVILPVGRVKPGQLPASKVARTIYHGPYEGLGAAWGEFVDWIEANGHTPAPDLWECYLTGPEMDPDPETWQTQLNRPLVVK